jgi:hypothetical protein
MAGDTQNRNMLFCPYSLVLIRDAVHTTVMLHVCSMATAQSMFDV